MTYFIIFLIGTAFGFLLLLQFSKWDANQKIKKLKEQHDSVFLEIERLIGTKSLYFLGRYNNNVTFKVITKDSKMDLVFFLDKKDICLFKKDQCLYSTQLVDKRIVENICSKLEQSFSTEMSDCVKIMGNIIDRKTVLKLLLQRYAPMSIEMIKAETADQSVVKKVNEDDTIEVEYIDNSIKTHQDTSVEEEHERIKLFIENSTSEKELLDGLNNIELNEELQTLADLKIQSFK